MSDPRGPKPTGFDNTELTLTMSERTDGSGGRFFYVNPDLPADVTVCLADLHIMFFQGDGTSRNPPKLKITKNRRTVGG